MSVAIDKFKYKLHYVSLFGGVSALTEEQFLKVNGFSNVFFGWGGEDDDMYNRLINSGYKISRYSKTIARYKMIKHKADVPNPERYRKLYSGKKRFKTDGINSIVYKLMDLVLEKLFTWILVEI
jgi:GT2 family glycosyltransferase